MDYKPSTDHPWKRVPLNADRRTAFTILTHAEKMAVVQGSGWERFPDEKYRNTTPFRLN